jgi:UDP-2,3-diacylglucosamine pyrophosphatase LpxH
MGKEPYSFSKKIKASVKKAVKHISDFETTATDLAIQNQYDYVICGHIHEPKIVDITNKNGTTLYLNSGDWVENLTALEYHNKKWKLYKYEENSMANDEDDLFEMENFLSQQLSSSILFDEK